MIIWISLVIPIPAAAVLYWKFQHKITLWEMGILLGTPILLTAGFKGCVEHFQTRDTEFWGGHVTTAEYYEDWNERVSCSHAIYRTDKKGNSQIVGYQHAYDVDYHPPYWEIDHNMGGSIGVSREAFEELSRRFGNRAFVNLHRSYHTKNGDKYVTTWDGQPATIEPITTEHSYENRILASQSVFNFKTVNPADYGLYEYPKIEGYTQRCVLGNAGPTTIGGEKKLQYLNAVLGKPHQVRLYVLVWKDQPIQAAMEQEAYWKRGNKNELVSCVGLNKDSEVQWVHVFSWSEAEELKIEARNFIMGQKVLDLEAYATWLEPEIRSKWVRKNFKDFSYLTVEPPLWAVITTFFVTLSATAGIALWAILNSYDPVDIETQERKVLV